MTPQKLGLFIVACCLAAFVGFYIAVSKAHASTGDSLSPTARDYQRFNACTNASVRPDIPGKDQVNEAIKCAAWGKSVAVIEQKYPYKFGTPVKKGGNEAQNERIAYAWEISKWTESTAFLNMIAGENGKFDEKRRSNVVTKFGRENSWGFCQLNANYKSRYFKKDKDGKQRIFDDWKYQMRVCFNEFQRNPHHFYGGNRNNMWMYEWKLPSDDLNWMADESFYRRFRMSTGSQESMPEFDGLYGKYLKLYTSLTK
jgi:hypothetical protein